MKVYTVATSLEDPWGWGTGIRLLRDSCQRCGHELVVLGVGEAWTGFGMKLRLLLDAIRDEPSDAVILFVDAYDVVFLPSGHDVLRRFRTFDTPIVFSAESCCWPFTDRAGRYPEPATRHLERVDPRIAAVRPGPPSRTPFKYLNSGSYIGYAGALKRAILELSPADDDDDQGLFTDYFLEHPTRISLDYGALLFHTLYGVESDRFVVESSPLGLRSRITDSRPCLVHGNGSGKFTLLRLIDGLREKKWP